MLELIVSKRDPSSFATCEVERFPLEVGFKYLLGRHPLGPISDSAVRGIATHDSLRVISRQQATLEINDAHVVVRHIDSARNPTCFQGENLSEFTVRDGESFHVADFEFHLESQLSEQGKTIGLDVLQQATSVDPDLQLRVLANLSSKIRVITTEQQAQAAALKAIMEGVPRCEVAALVRIQDRNVSQSSEISIDRIESKSTEYSPFVPSARIVRNALIVERKPHYQIPALSGIEVNSLASFDWALCVPLPAEPVPGCGIYVSGKLRREDIKTLSRLESIYLSDLKFVQIVADILGSLKHMSELNRVTTELKEFLPSCVIGSIRRGNSRTRLAPRAADVTFAFCDLRNSCGYFSEDLDDPLLVARWSEINRFLEIFSTQFLSQEAVIEDLEGDAVKAFWGWPDAMDLDKQVDAAIRATKGIMRRFAVEVDVSRLQAGFGMGIAVGKAVVGRLGTTDQFKISVCGQTPNLAQRLQEFTKPKYFDSQVLVDDGFHEMACHLARSRLGEPFTEHLATVQPRGIGRPVKVCRVLADNDIVSLNHLELYESGRELFEHGQWNDAWDTLELLSESGPARFLLKVMDSFHRQPPADWNGVIDFNHKSLPDSLK